MEVSIKMLLFICPMIFLAGLIDSVAGGGGLISIPAYLAVGLPPHMATATNKCSSTFGTLLATVKYLKNGKIHWFSILYSIAFSLIGSSLGAMLNIILPEKYLYWFLIITLPLIAVFIIFKKDFGKESEIDTLSKMSLFIRCAILAFVIGVYDGFFGPATGTFLIIALTMLCKMDILTASGNAKVLNLVSNISAFVIFVINGNILWKLAIPATLCGLVGQYIGSSLAIKKGAKIIRPMFIIVLILLFGSVIFKLI